MKEQIKKEKSDKSEISILTFYRNEIGETRATVSKLFSSVSPAEYREL